MADFAHAETDKKIAIIEYRLNRVYSKTKKELTKKFNDYVATSKKATDKAYSAWQNSIGTSDESVLKEKYETLVKKATLQSKHWQNMLDEVTAQLANVNQTALAYVNDELNGVYTLNYNAVGSTISDKIPGYSFDLVDESTVKNLILHDKTLLPTKKLNVSKDKKWNTKKINSQVLQGILQGESIDTIATRLENVSDMNRKSAIRNARTMCTGAENKGRTDSYSRAEKSGLMIKKQWLATSDARTRDWHIALNGKEEDNDKPFINAFGKILFPGDPSAHPANVYNCRCTLAANIVGANGKLFKDLQTVNKADYQGKKMSHVYNDMKAENTTLANHFYAELKSQGKPPEVWASYLKGELDSESAVKIDKYLIAHQNKGVVGSPKKVKISDANAKTQKVVKTQQTLDEITKQMESLANTTYSGIWVDDISIAEYPEKLLSGSIDKKKQYYESQLLKLSPGSAKYNELESYLHGLEHFEEQGKQYVALQKKLDKLQPKPKVLPGKFSPDSYAPAAKKSAKAFIDKNKADKYHRPNSDKAWRSLDGNEKYSIWEYTRNSNPINKSLSGYHDDWDRWDYIGPDKTDWGHEDSWRSIPSAFGKYGKNGNVDYHRTITKATTAIEKSTLKDDVWLVRGSSSGGLAGLLEGNLISFDDANTMLMDGDITSLKKLEGKVFQSHSFMSTGIAEGTGFSDNISYRIYAPKGTHAIYAEPQSYFGKTIGSKTKLYSPGMSYSDVGREAEVIIQRGTKFRITKIEQVGPGGYEVEMEIVEQPDYFKFGDEDTYNEGKTRHKK